MKQFYLFAAGLVLAGSTTAYAQVKVQCQDARQQAVAAKLLNTNASRTVLATKQVSNGIEKRIVRDNRGRVFIDMVRNGKVSAAPQSLSLPRRADSEASFYEGFEGHQGELDWIPEGWVELNTEANLPTLEMCAHNINNSWSVQDTGDGQWTAITTDGVKEAWIHFTYDWEYTDSNGEKVSGKAAEQDEWLITPAIDVKDGENLYFLGEVDLGSIYPFDWSSMEYDLTANPDCDLEVLVSTDGGDTWKKAWSVSANVCSTMTPKEMYDLMAELKYYNFNVSLADYAGKTVKIAFRYRNIGDGWGGNSMAVDAVTVSKPQPEAFYQLPYGTLLAGVTTELSVGSASNCLMPAWASITWDAESNNTTEHNEWTVYDAQTEQSNIVSGNSVTLEYAYSNGEAYPYPLLTAKAGDLTDAYSYDIDDAEVGGIYYGGRLPVLKIEGYPDETVLVGNYDYKHKRLNSPYLDTDAYCFGTAPADTWGTGVTQTAFGNFFPAPSAPFTIDDVYVTLGECDMDADAELLLSIYEVDEQGKLSETPAATATVKGSDIAGFGLYQVKFHLAAPYAMKGHTLMMVSGFANNDKIRKIAGCAQALPNDADHNYAYMMFDINGKSALYSASNALIDYSSALYFSLDGAFHFLRPETEIVDLDRESNQVTVNFTASSTPDKWWIVDGENSLPIAAEGTTYKWLTIAPAAEGNALNFIAEPTEEDRAVTVSLANGGDEARVRIRQKGNSGVEAIVAAGNGVSLNGDILTVAGAADSQLTVYSVDGRIVAKGANGLDISGIADGVYVVRAGRTAYKFVK